MQVEIHLDVIFSHFKASGDYWRDYWQKDEQAISETDWPWPSVSKKMTSA
jgi:hypothetical protein